MNEKNYMNDELNITKKIGIDILQFNILKNIITQYKILKPNLKASIFDSRARGCFKKFSDIDLLIEVDPPFSQLEKFHLKNDFEESNLVYKVDLVFKEEILETYKDSILEILIDI